MSRALLAIALSLVTTPALPHPHVFVDAKAGFAVDDRGLTGLRITWLYDAFTTLVLYEQLDLDRDGDGKLDAADLERVAFGETDWAPEYEGDTYLWVDGAKEALGRPRNGVARMVGDQVEVSFDLPLAAPEPLGGLSASLRLYDPAYYYAYDVTGTDGSVEGCAVALVPFEPDAEDQALQDQLSALSQEEVPDDPTIGARFADEITLQCD